MPSPSELPLLRPVPRRPNVVDPSSSSSSSPSPISSIALEPSAHSPSDSLSPTENGAPKRSKSAIALTASTLFGIYSLSDENNKDAGPSSPSLLSRNPSILSMADFDLKDNKAPKPDNPPARTRPEPRKRAAPLPLLILRIASLFAFGVAYGVIVTRLHNSKRFSPVTVDIDRYDAWYLVQWGIAGVVLGSLLPWLDGGDVAESAAGNGAKIDWDPVVRSVGAFVGIAYAIRKLPWQSTLQVSVSLSLVNPFLWYLVDRTRAGFWFSAAVGVSGTALLLRTNPEMIKAPETLSFPDESKVAGIVPVESISVAVWIASVLFCSCVCFGNIGRKLALIESR